MSHTLPRFNISSSKRKGFRQQFDQLNHQNIQLIKLADHISRSNFMQQPNHYPSAIFKLQQELRAGFSAFVESIRQFFIDMDHRLRTLGEALAQHIATQQQQVSQKRFNTVASTDTDNRHHSSNQNIVLKINQTNGDPFQMFSQRIATLQENLKKTQQNEHRLLNIVEKLNRRTSEQSFQLYNAPDTTDLSSNNGRQSQRHNFQPNLSHERSFRVFALQQPPQQPRIWTQTRPEQKYVTSAQQVRGKPLQFKREPVQQSNLNNPDQHHRMRYMMHGLYN